ncbi:MULTISPECIES: formate dehydrogenase subunit gamma [Snodgrassella]|uniref:Formate dehydrogenase subunit gamma n=1 Tax=Snodgrassella alvi TaxID=1196083 RepID=A0A2N9XTQ2_9NEIS|nr:MULTISPECIES: formate dehydrogenase subunit gamma [Snodgrassella]PIT52744.1 formate dehydrogenase subunit gamma [Snodgrassella communis]
MKKLLLQRYKKSERFNHWVVAGCFVLLAISGLGFFYPSFFWLTEVFGSPQLARILHPFIGVVMFLGFFIQFFRYVKFNFFERDDLKWLLGIRHILVGREIGDTGKYNAGQKIMFWVMTISMALLLLSGLIAWRQYFSGYFPIWVVRIALLVHSASAILLIVGIIIHVYAALWIKGTIPAMVEGVVTQEWAKKHHPRWYREMMAKKEARTQQNSGSQTNK